MNNGRNNEHDGSANHNGRSLHDGKDPQDTTEMQVALYLAGGMSKSEMIDFDRRLDDPDDPARRVLAELEPVIQSMMNHEQDLSNLPSTELRERLLAQIADDIADKQDEVAPSQKQQHQWADWENEQANQGLYTLRADEGEWLPTDIDGIEVRNLYVDKKANRMTAMFRMAAGTSYIPHVHDDYEECYVLQGDLHVGDLVMKPGDYQRAEAGSLHGPQRTEGGCVLLITSSMTDEHV